MDKNELCREIEQIYPDLLKRWDTHDLFCRIRFDINFLRLFYKRNKRVDWVLLCSSGPGRQIVAKISIKVLYFTIFLIYCENVII